MGAAQGHVFTMRNFWHDRRGNYGMLFAIALVPIMGGLALAVDYYEISSQKQATLNALDAAGIATARHIVTGASDTQVIAYANEFFKTNLGSAIDPADARLTVMLPTNQAGGGTLKLDAHLNYRPYFYNVFTDLLGNAKDEGDDTISVSASTEIRLKNTLEVSLVLDNSGSMNDPGSGSGQKRIDLLKTAAKQLVDTLALQANLIKQIEKPVQFSLVPFAASVNVGPENADSLWMDKDGISPVHHENFNWASMSSGDKRAVATNGIWRKAGAGWNDEQGEVLSRFTLYKDMRHVSSREWVVTGKEYICTRYRSNGTCREGAWKETGYYDETITGFASWQGCVEARPYPHNVSDTPPNASVNEVGAVSGDPATMFVPMFGVDEPGDRWEAADASKLDNFSAANNWWNDKTESTGVTRLKNVAKYFDVRPFGATSPQGTGPNYGCTTKPLTPLVDVSQPAGLSEIKTAIDAMAPNGATNVPEGIAWGWRTLSSAEPFPDGRPETERGNDKVVIVLTDGANTYYTPGSLGFSDPADNKSIYSAYGYLKPGYNGSATPRLFMGTSGAIGKYDYSNTNYSNALNEQMAKVCTNAKDGKVLVMTVALDLDSTKSAEAAQIKALKDCSSDSRFRKDPTDATKPAKLFWNATGSNLSEKFKEIADELSNLRIVG